MRSIKSICVLAIVIGLLGGLACSPAYANSPWWHLSSSSRPTYLQPGQAKNEVQRLTVRASEGTYVVERPGVGVALLQAGETPEQVQRSLEEELYGAGNVSVTAGIGTEDTNPFEVYEIEFTGELGSQPIEPISVRSEKLNVVMDGKQNSVRLVSRRSSRGAPME